MPGTKAGGLKTRETNLAKDPEFYSKIGKIGGSKGKGRDYQKGGIHAIGFAAHPELAKEAGRKGGSISRRTAKKPQLELIEEPLVVPYPWWVRLFQSFRSK